MAHAESADSDTAPAGSAASDFEHELAQQAPVRWIGWRLRLLVGAALLGCLGIMLLVQHVASTPVVDAVLRSGPTGASVLVASSDPALRPYRGRALRAITARDGSTLQADGTLLQRVPRWTAGDRERERLVEAQRWLHQALQSGPVEFQFEGGGVVRVSATERGITGLGLLFWPLAALALLLYLTGTAAWLVRPDIRNGLYFVIATCQAANLVFIGAESVPGLPLPGAIAATDLWLRLWPDLITAAAVLHAVSLHLAHRRAGRWIAVSSWLTVAVVLLAGRALPTSHWWWWSQATAVVQGMAAIAVLSWAYRLQPNPHTMILRRFGLFAVGSVVLLIVALAASAGEPDLQQRVIETGSVIWYVFLASLLLLLPFLSRSRQLLREFALLAGISTLASSLDLLFVAFFSLGQFASLALSLFVALGVYAGARQWILNQLTGSNALTLERSFEALYRTAREVEAHPERHGALLLRLLRELFEPLEVLHVERPLARARVAGDGSALLVPTPPGAPYLDGGTHDAASERSWVLRFAQRGRRLFTDADARLADRIAEQLRRAVGYDRAVERGRSEERLRIAQDLHDDIGARLLTLMYQAQSPEMEDYIRHTLQDLKTLTRGLASRELRLSHAIAEWKSDITQRLAAAHIRLVWSFAYDRDIKLTVVQWSALTRVLRELVTNTIYHAQSSQVEICGQVDGARLHLVVADDGLGTHPEKWSHGLGLGGVRKRVKQLGGGVHWGENAPRGIVCEVTIDRFCDPAPATAPADDGR